MADSFAEEDVSFSLFSFFFSFPSYGQRRNIILSGMPPPSPKFSPTPRRWRAPRIFLFPELKTDRLSL